MTTMKPEGDPHVEDGDSMPHAVAPSLLPDPIVPGDPPYEYVDTYVSPSIPQRLLMIPWIGVLIAIILIGAYLTFRTGTIFFSTDNLFAVTQDFSYIAIAALGSALVIICGGIDLSVGSTMGLVGVLTVQALNDGWPVAVAILAGIGIGMGIGIINSLLITGIRLAPFVATLGMLSAIRGFSTGHASGQTIGAPDAFNVIGQGQWGPIPISLVLLITLAIGCHFLLNNTTWGRHVFAVGGNEHAARLLGIKVVLVKCSVYILAAVLAAIGGIVLSARLGSASPGYGVGYELVCIASAVIGGASLTGGEGSIFGVLVGAALLAEIRNGLELLGWGDYWQDLVIGLTILLAVSVDQVRRRLRVR
jgi:ribose transport system permease protein